MRLTLFIITLLCCLISCKTVENYSYTPYPFQIEGFDWDPDPYKFSAYIQDSIVPNKGRQYAAWDYSYIGNIKQMLQSWDEGAAPKTMLTQEEKENWNNFEQKEAIPFILEKAKGEKVTIINEAHHMPQHRVFTTQLLQGMYDVGYRHLGLETVFSSHKSDSTLLANGYPLLTNGYYIKEPQFGNMIREALKIGFQIFGYESKGHENSKGREINQAKNIQEYILENPAGKVLIHCGFAHGTEGIYGGSWGKAMAGRLTEFTEIDPLTINQTTFSERSKIEFENPYYQLATLTEPSVFVMKQDSVFGQYKPNSWFDISVFHPRSSSFDRPEWLLYGSRRVKTMNFDQLPFSYPCLVFAYVKGEKIGSAIPYDVQETATGQVDLVLEAGAYDIIIWNEDGEALRTGVVVD